MVPSIATQFRRKATCDDHLNYGDDDHIGQCVTRRLCCGFAGTSRRGYKVPESLIVAWKEWSVEREAWLMASMWIRTICCSRISTDRRETLMMVIQKISTPQRGQVRVSIEWPIFERTVHSSSHWNHRHLILHPPCHLHLQSSRESRRSSVKTR